MSNQGEGKGTGKMKREAVWRDRFVRFSTSGQSIAAFCNAESVSSVSFYRWRSQLGLDGIVSTSPVKRAPAESPFIDLGAIRPGSTIEEATGKIELRIDLGAGVQLTIIRH